MIILLVSPLQVPHRLALEKPQPPPFLGAHTNRVSATTETRELGVEGRDTAVMTTSEEPFPEGIRAHVTFLQSGELDIRIKAH